MNIKTLFFGITTELVGASQLQIQVKENTSIATFKATLKQQFSNLENINSYAVAVNEEYTVDDYKIQSGDVIAIIPPVSGG